MRFSNGSIFSVVAARHVCMAEVGCAGVLVSDIFCGPMDNLPREGQLLAIDAIEPGAGGCAANVAIGLAKQGISVDLAGCVGADSSATSLLGSLENDGVGCSHVAVNDQYPTSKTVILVVAGQDRRYIHTFGANKAFCIEHIDREWVKRLKVFYLGGLLILPAVDLGELRELLGFLPPKRGSDGGRCSGAARFSRRRYGQIDSS